MSKPRFRNFSDIVSEVLVHQDDDPLLHILALTYEFDDAQLLNLTCGRALEEQFEPRQSHLKLLSDIRPLVVFDARKTRQFSGIPQFLELHPYKTKSFACHHSKAYLIITRNKIRLALGSFNLTQTGLFCNREVMQSFCWSAHEQDRSDGQILVEWIGFLREHYLPMVENSSRSALASIIENLTDRVKVLAPHMATSSHLLYSGYGGQKGLDSLRTRWQEWFPDSQPQSLLVVSPFFDESPQNGNVADAFADYFPSLSEMRIITDQQYLLALSRTHFGTGNSISGKAAHIIPSEISKGESERIEKRAGMSIKDRVINRRLHAKLLLLRAGEKAIAYLGSANFSRKAWLDANQELGMVWVVHDPEAFTQQVLKCLEVTAQDVYNDLSVVPADKQQEKDDEGYTEDSLFPDFIEGILLEPDAGSSQVRFRFECKDPSAIGAYRVSWSDIELSVAEGLSQWIPREDFQKVLLSGRTLEFRSRAVPDKFYWYPFQYSGELIAEREGLIHRSSWDWLLSYLYPDSARDVTGPEFVPGIPTQAVEAGDTYAYEIDREKNCVIAMQRYLTLFSRIESEFRQRMESVRKISDPASHNQALASQVVNPLEGLRMLLSREHPKNIIDRIFKLGELKQLVLGLRGELDSPSRSQFDRLIQSIDCSLAEPISGSPLNNLYLGYIKSLESEAR